MDARNPLYLQLRQVEVFLSDTLTVLIEAKQHPNLTFHCIIISQDLHQINPNPSTRHFYSLDKIKVLLTPILWIISHSEISIAISPSSKTDLIVTQPMLPSLLDASRNQLKNEIWVLCTGHLVLFFWGGKSAVNWQRIAK